MITLRIPYKQATEVKPGLVLLVEDNLDIRETVRGYLQKMGHAVIEADSAEEAIGLGHLPDLVVGGLGFDVGWCADGA